MSAHLQGVVTNNGVPVAGIRLGAYNQSTNQFTNVDTAPDGTFDLGLGAGTWQVQVDSQSAAAFNVVGTAVDYTLTENQTLSGVTLAVKTATAQITGYVRAPLSQPLNASVNANATIDGVVYSANAQTDSSGNYVLPVINGTWQVSASANDFSNSSPVTTIVSGANVIRNFTLTKAPVITQHPVNQTVIAGQGLIISIEASSSAEMTFQWQVSTDGGTIWNDLSNNATYSQVTSSTLGINASPGLNGHRYRCIATNSFGAATSNSALLTVLAPEIAVFDGNGTGGPERQSDTGSFSFPNTLVGASSAAQTFTIQNTGAFNLTGLAVTKGGAHPGDFTVGNLGVNSLAPDSTTTFAVIFSPTATGTRSAVLQIASNDANENPFIIQVTGNDTLTASYADGTEVPLITSAYTATGNTVNFVLNYAPVIGTELMVVNNTGLGFINGVFSNVQQGQTVSLSYGGSTYDFVANYFGGTGNDLVLQWAYTRAFSWGNNAEGQLGDNSTTQRNLPVAVSSAGVLAGKTVLGVATGQNHSVAFCSDGTVAAWGRNAEGQLGDGSTTQRNVPVAVNRVSGISALFGKTVVAVAAGENHSLALCSDGTVAAWGLNEHGELGDDSTTNRNVPVAVNTASGVSALFGKTVVSIAAGGHHSMALCSDGTLAAWGFNDHGQIGDNTTTSRDVPMAVNTSGGSALSGRTVVAIAAGAEHSLALCTDGMIAAWGGNSSGGQLGDNTTTDRPVPVAVNTASGISALFGKSVTAIAAGGYHSMALCSDGTLTAWGSNTDGNLGDNSTTQRTAPVVVNASSGVSALFGKTVLKIAAGLSHSMAYCADGTVAIWGRNVSGQLGDDSTTQRNVPVVVDSSPLAVGERFTSVTSRSQAAHTLALVATAAPAPVIVVEQPAGVPLTDGVGTHDYGSIFVGVASTKTFLIKNTGTATLSGISITLVGSAAAQYAVTAGPATTVAPGGSTSFIVTFAPTSAGPKPATLRIASNVSGTTNPFDVNLSGTGNATLTANYTTGAEVPATANGFTATGKTVNFALNYAPVTGSSLMVVNNTGTGFINGTFSNLAHGQAMALNFNGITYRFIASYYGGTGNDLVLQWAGTRLLAWGANTTGALGNNTTSNSDTPVAVDASGVLVGKTVIAVACGQLHSIALCSDGTLAAWGANNSGQLGDNSTTQRHVPVLVDMTGVLSGKTVVAIAAGNDFSMALCSDGKVAAWGLNDVGQLGDNTTTNRQVPVLVNTAGALAGKTAVSIAAGYDFCLVACADGSLVSWGQNEYGQLGNNSTTDSAVPVVVSTAGVLAGKTVTAVAAGHYHSLAVCTDGTLAGWGDNTYGELGNNSTVSSLVPVSVSTAGALSGKTPVALAAGQSHSMALCADGTLVTWGDNTSGQLGNGTFVQSLVPVEVTSSGALSGKVVAAIAAGMAHNIARLTDGTLAAWGLNGSGQIGDGSTTNSNLPVAVSTTSLIAGERIVQAASGTAASHDISVVAVPLAALAGPSAITNAATGVTKTTATLQGSANPNEVSTMASFEYGLTTSYGSETTAQNIGAGTTSVNLSPVSLSGLQPNTAYHFRTKAVNSSGTALGDDVVFITDADPPVAVSAAPASVTNTTATLAGAVNPNGRVTDVYFEHGTTALYGSTTALQSLPVGTSAVDLTAAISGLLPNVTYHCRIVAINAGGTASGSDITFTTTDFQSPTVTTDGQPAISTTSVRVSGTVRAHNASTQVFFDYGTDGVTFPNSVPASPPVVTGDVATPVSAVLPNLSQGTYHYRVRAVSAGGTTSGESFSALLTGLLQQFPDAPPSALSSIIVTLAPSGITSGWRIVGEQQWRNSGTSIAGLTLEDREIEYRPVPGYIQPPKEIVGAPEEHSAVVIERDYYVTPVSGSGGISVTLKPESITTGTGRAQWRFLGEDNTQWRDSGASVNGLPAGSYLVECKPVTGRATPPPASVLISSGQTSAPTLTYFQTDPQTGTPPAVLSFATVSTDTAMPYAHVGQIRSNVGTSTGFVVKPRVVATAAHVVWDDGTLAAVQGLQWLFQRDAGTYEPKPLIPRGFYLFDGYSAQRIQDNSPGESSPQSQNLDAAAMYFTESAGRGGHGGFLASDLTDNEFLLSSAQKTLVGYPVDGIPAIEQGRMHATPLANVNFTHAFERTFTTTAIRSSGGNSGGPLCIQYQGGGYYPAAIYLGGTGQTVVRAIDSAVVELFSRAEVSANTGANNTGGGITLTSVTGSYVASNPGALRILIGPEAATSPPAGWRLAGSNSSFLLSGYSKGSLTPGVYVLELTTISGFQPPASQNVTVTGGQSTTYTYTYAPVMTPQESWRQANFGTTSNSGNAADNADPDGDGMNNQAEFTAGTNPNSVGDVFKVSSHQKSGGTFTLTTAGKSGRTYILERSASLGASASWSTVTTQGPLGADGTVTLTDNATPGTNAFYRIRVTGP
ncbi:MAG: choice-of-anchor D domain-containing protein [Verrucomicrobiaceae bacterium]